MKILDDIEDLPASPVTSYAALLEKIEILRSTLRWSSRMERPEIEKLLRQASVLRDDVMQLSHRERFVQAAVSEPQRVPGSPRERREALLARSFVFEGTFGDNPKLLEALEIAEKAAPTDLPVLVDGESGTGKELMAKVIHANGARADKPYISVNCGAIPENLLESELFGHKKGAFTGASNDRKGKFESAHTGTIFLDEIGELPQEAQVALLRVLQEREIERVGSSDPITVDVRVLAATNSDLEAAVERGAFREDLFYRLNVVPIRLPPLRDRAADIPILVEYLVDRFARQTGKRIRTIEKQTLQRLAAYDWPGNVRELQNVIERAVVLSEGDTFAIDESWLTKKRGRTGSTLADGEKAMIEAALTESQGRVAGPRGAAAKLGIPRQTLEWKIRNLNIDKLAFKR